METIIKTACPKCVNFNDCAYRKRYMERSCPTIGDVAIGWDLAEQATIEKACKWLFKYNQSQAHKHGAKALLGVLDFTVNVEDFRKFMEGE